MKITSALLITFLFAATTLVPFSTHAAISSWQRGASIVPQSSTDFASATFKQSLQELRNTGANSVALVIPFYQTNIYSTDVAVGWNTPTDASLAAGIDYAHSIGLQVSLKVHIETYDNAWRANINPSDRDTWFNNYGAMLVHTAQIAQAHQAEYMILGTELVSMASSQMNSTNTQHWVTMIGNVRKVYSGKLSYSANSNDNSDNQFTNEKKYIGFWSSLDFVGLSTYYSLNAPDNSVQSLSNAWNAWNANDIKGFAAQVGKPIIFTEVGYRSIEGSYNNPWDYNRSSPISMQTQANAYEALFSYWNNYSYMQGVYLWDWKSNASAGGPGSNEYTPQNKTAESIMTKYFGTPPAPVTPAGDPSFSASATAQNGTVGQDMSLGVTVTDISGNLSNGIVDIEIYDSNNTRVFQKAIENVSIQSSASYTNTVHWTPSQTGQYRIAIGVFAGGWTKNYYWLNSAQTFSVTAGTTSTPPPTTGNGQTNIWWPSDGSHVHGTQPFKAMLSGFTLSQYTMYWQVDGGGLVLMSDNQTDYPHKEFLTDLTNWNWKGSGPYKITFVSKDTSGNIIDQKSVNIYVD
ncbi:MAG: hypothetical protein JWO50_845 [Candidatus Kaiserbacteria bacterium]|nr:hypothetical protein [Candidatus Kaiserbacteria bacterium]